VVRRSGQEENGKRLNQNQEAQSHRQRKLKQRRTSIGPVEITKHKVENKNHSHQKNGSPQRTKPLLPDARNQNKRNLQEEQDQERKELSKNHSHDKHC
jgi:hypothetical protein